MPDDLPQQDLLDRLRALPASGAAGFEGFVRDCLQETLGIRFRLMKSGPQDGADIRDDAPSNAMRVAVEGKRYGNATPLPTEELELKIVSASNAEDPPDLWVLATTRAISATDRGSLAKTGDRQGVATAVIDAADGEDEPSALHVLASAAPRSVRRHLPELPAATAAWLAGFASESEHTGRLERVLEPFRRGDVGYAAARSAMDAWLVTAMSDEATARARLDCFAGLGAADAIVVERTSVDEQLDAWMDAGPTSPLALLGHEGVGKTWSLLDWWRRRRERSADLPMTLVVAASAIGGVGDVSGPDLVARLLAQRLPIRGEEFWRRRLSIWSREAHARPRIVLVVDGLNQQPDFTKWQQVLQPLFDREWNGLFGAAVTCRHAWWTEDLKRLATVTPPFLPVSVPVFDDGELDRILARFDLARDDFDRDMLELLAIPRYCQLAIARRRELSGSGDVTVERLIFEDWRHRIARVGPGLTPSEDEFRAFIAEQGAALRASIDGEEPTLSRREIVEALDRDTGRGEPALRMSLSEIVDGRWMRRTEGGGQRFSLETRHVPFALALALYRELVAAGRTLADDRLATFMDPLRGTDRGTAILRHAVTVALLEEGGPDWTFPLLMDAWFSQQNIGPLDVRTLGQLAPAAPLRFLRFAESMWSERRQHLRDDGLLIDAVVRAAVVPGFREALRAALAVWLARYTARADDLPRAVRSDPGALERLRAARDARAAKWAQARVGLGAHDDAFAFDATRDDAPGDARRLVAFASGVLSHLPRAEFARCYVAWAVSRAIEEDGTPSGMDWAIRVNHVDPEAGGAALLEAARRLASFRSPVAHGASERLLDALAADRGSRGDRNREGRGSGRIVVPARRPVGAAIDGTGPSLASFSALGRDALLPGSAIGAEELAALRSAADAFDASRLMAAGRSRSSEDLAFEQAEAVLARWAPRRLAAILRSAYRSAPARMARDRRGDDDAETAVWGLVHGLPGCWPLLGEREIASLAPVIEAFLPRAFEEGSSEWLHLQVPRLRGRSAAEQIALFADDPEGPNFFEVDTSVLAAPAAADFPRLAELLAGPHAANWLGYLLHAGAGAMPDGFHALHAQVASDDPVARRRALQIIRHHPREERSRRLVEGGWTWTETMDIDEGAAGSLALLRARSVTPVPGLETRVHPEVLGAIAALHPDDDAALDRFAAWLVERVRDHRRGDGSLDRQHWLDQEDALLVVVRRRPEPLVEALDELLSADPERAFAYDSFPVVDVVRGLCRARPDDGARIWERLRPTYLESRWTLPRFEQAPFLGDAEVLRPLQETSLADAMTDGSLETVVSAALDGGHEDWLLGRMDALLRSSSAGTVAKGLMVARFLDPSTAADARWRVIDGLQLPSWLSDLRRRAREEYDLGRTAASAAGSLLLRNDPDLAYADLVILKHSADARAVAKLREAVEERYVTLSPSIRALWAEWRGRLESSGKRNSEGREKRYLYDEMPRATHHPWR